MYAGSTTRRPTSSCVPAPLRSVVSNTVGCQSSFAESAASFALSPGMLAPVLERTMLVEAHLEALVRVQHRSPSAEPDAVRLLRREPSRRGRARGARADVVDPLARAQQPVRPRVVRLPHCAAVRREREAADARPCSGRATARPRRRRLRARARRRALSRARAAGARQGRARRGPARRRGECCRASRRPATRPSSRRAQRGSAAPRRASVSSTSAAATSWSTISRFTCTSCQTRYGLSVAIAAATRPARRRSTTRADLVDEPGRRDRERRSARCRSTTSARRRPSRWG